MYQMLNYAVINQNIAQITMMKAKPQSTKKGRLLSYSTLHLPMKNIPYERALQM